MDLLLSIKNILKKLIRRTGYELVPAKPKGLGYLSAASVLKEIREKNITLNRYLENLWGMDTSSHRVLSQIEIIPGPSTIVEIGAGTGMFTGKFIDAIGQNNIKKYQVYETDKGWAGYLNQSFDINVENANGYSLPATETASCDIVHAHGVYVYTSFMTTVSYLREMLRVASTRSIIIFDVFDESCFDDDTISAWIESEDLYPNIIPESYLKDLFTKHNFEIRKTFYAPFGKGRSRYYVFHRIS
jgi:hypothetical protein